MDQGRNSTYKLLSQSVVQEMDKKNITFVDSGHKSQFKIEYRKEICHIQSRYESKILSTL
jgi:beta-lactamase superfamily II metal-dependent hydrolase